MKVPEAEFKAWVEQHVPFNRVLGLRLESVGEGCAVARLPFKEDLIGDIFRPALHGGAIAALIDAIGGAAAFTTVELGDRLATIDMRVDFLRPGPKKDLVATADVRRAGNRVVVVHVEVVPEGETAAVAEGRCVFNVMRKAKE